MDRFMKSVRRSFGTETVLADERGLSTVEYVIILVLIAAAAIGAWVSLGGKVKEKIGDANTEMDKVQVQGQ